MRRWILGGVRFFAVTVGIIGLTSLSIDATDVFRGSQSALGIFARSVTEGACPAGMVEVPYPDGGAFCMDAYEVSASGECEVSVPGSPIDTAANAADPNCQAVSEVGKTPWTNIAQAQAEQLCARTGKRLPTATEWYLGVRGTPDNASVCNTSGALRGAGVQAECVSGVGVFDGIGNVWEWVSGSVSDGQFEDITIPDDGYVAAVNDRGIPTEATTSPQTIFNDDYVWNAAAGTRVIMRGGFHGSRGDAGVYSFHADVDQYFQSAAVGFRCVLVRS